MLGVRYDSLGEFVCQWRGNDGPPRRREVEAVSEVTRRPKPPSVDSRFRENDEMLCRITHQFILSESDIVITVLA